MTHYRQIAHSNVYGYPVRNDISVGRSGSQLLIEARRFGKLPPFSQQERDCTPQTITLEAPANRAAWKHLYRMARSLARRGSFSARTKHGKAFTLVCNNRRVRFSH